MAPDHEYPSYLELELTATDGFGLTRTITRRLDPKTVGHHDAVAAGRREPDARDRDRGRPVHARRDPGLGADVTAPTPVTIGGTTYAFSSWSDGGALTHVITAPATAATYTATFAQTTTPTQVAGTNVIGLTGSDATTGRAEVYRTTASANARVTSIALRVAPTSTATAVVLGLYADSGGQPTTLLASGRLDNPQAGAWNEVTINNGRRSPPGRRTGSALLNPTDATGVLRWRDRAGRQRRPRADEPSRTLAALPATWARGATWSDGPLSAYVMGSDRPAAAAGARPSHRRRWRSAARPGSATRRRRRSRCRNTGGGSLNFTASDDAPWLTVTPASGTAPD